MAVNYMVRINMNMTVIVMVKQKASATSSALETAECLGIAGKSWNSTMITFSNNTESISNSTFNDLETMKVEKKEVSFEKMLLRYLVVNYILN